MVNAGDELVVWYSGSFVEGGEIFDGNYDFSAIRPIEGTTFLRFTLGSGDVIEGWDIALEGRRLGEIILITVPADLAYGESGRGSIPPNADLNFLVELLGARPAGQSQYDVPSLSDLGVPVAVLSALEPLQSAIEDSRIGTDQDDVIGGSDKQDLLVGLIGKDRFQGGLGADLLIGGEDSDCFVYKSLQESPVGPSSSDRILGFESIDQIDLTALRGRKRGSFIGAKRFKGRPGAVRFASGHLQLDTDGNRKADLDILIPDVAKLLPSNLLL